MKDREPLESQKLIYQTLVTLFRQQEAMFCSCLNKAFPGKNRFVKILLKKSQFLTITPVFQQIVMKISLIPYGDT